MRILLDECIDQRLAKELLGHEVKTVPQMGWTGLSNGELLGRAEGAFEIFVTVDANLPFQQELSRFSLATFLLRAPSNRLEELRPLISLLLAILPQAKSGEVRVIGGK